MSKLITSFKCPLNHRFLARSILDVNDPDFYEWETHIFFDDAFEPGPEELGNPRQVNQFVRLLIKQVDVQGIVI